jgi:hypothetical protein
MTEADDHRHRVLTALRNYAKQDIPVQRRKKWRKTVSRQASALRRKK